MAETADITTQPNDAAPPPPPSPSMADAADAVAGARNGGGSDTALPNGVTASPAATPAVTPASGVTPVHPVRRGGLVGILDDFRDAVAGHSESRVYTDEDGNKYIKNVTPSGANKWLRVAATAFTGAAAGLAAGRGAGNKGKAALAGVGVGTSIADKRAQQEKEAQKEVSQDQLDKFNMLKLKHDIAAGDFALTRLKTKAQEDEITFAQNQIDREKALGSADLGVYRDPYELAKVKQQDPQFWKNVYANNVVTVPEIGPEGERKGIHVFLRTHGIGDSLVPEGSTVYDYQPGEKPTDEPKLAARTLSAPATYNQVDAWNASAFKKKQDWYSERDKATKDTAETKLVNQHIEESKANTAKAWAETHKANVEAAATASGGTKDSIDSQAQALVDGRTAVSLLSRRSKDFNAIMAKADQFSQQQKGHPYDQQQGEVGYQAYKRVIENYSAGDAAKNIESFDKFLGHALDASQSVNGMRNTNVKLLNIPYNKLSTLTGGERSAALVAMMSKLETVRTEFESVLKNNTALTDQDKKSGEKLLDDNSTPAQMQATMKALAEVAATRLRASDFGFSRVVKAHVPDLISPEGARALQHFGIDPNSVYSQNVAAQPANSGQGTPVYQGDKLIGYTADGGKTMTPAGQ